MSDSIQQTFFFDVSGKTVTVWANATGRRQHNHDASDGYGCVIHDEGSDRWEEVQGEIEYENHHTAPVAKYKAIINGIKYVSKEYSGVSVIYVYTDAEVVVDQINSRSDVNKVHLQILEKKVTSLLPEFDEWHVGWQRKSKSHEIKRAKELAKDSIKCDSQ